MLYVMGHSRSVTWQDLLRFQALVVSRRQAVNHGVSAKSVARRAKSGTWQRLHRGTYATFSGQPPRDAQLWAAVLRAGPGAVLSHETAAELHGLTDKQASYIGVPLSGPFKPEQYRY